MLNIKHIVHIVGFEKSRNCLRHTAYHSIAQKQFAHTLMNTLVYRFFVVQAFAKIINVLLFDAVSPEPFFEIHRIHCNGLLKSYRNRSGFFFTLFLFGFIAVDTEQRPCTDYIVPAVEFEIF